MTLRWYRLHFPAALDAEPVVHFVRSLAMRARHGVFMTADPVICEIESSDGQLIWRLGCSRREAPQVLRALRLSVPNLRVVPEPEDSVRPSIEQAWELRLSSHRR